MKVLFIGSALGPDYQQDMLAHGLRSLLGPDFVDSPRIPYLYSDYGDHMGLPLGDALALLYGKGFTLYGLLPDDSNVDRTDIPAKIDRHYFDLIVFGSIHRQRMHWELVQERYRPSEILIVDGEDHQSYLGGLTSRGIYFKRELSTARPGLYPISFAIPREKLATKRVPKDQIVARMDPRDKSTYVYDTESEYYAEYGRSLFANTIPKGGWDCLRHLEIMSQHSVPLFHGINQCPPSTLTTLPKSMLTDALSIFEHHPPAFWDTEDGHSVWLSLERRIWTHLTRHCTTLALAEYVLSVQRGATL